MGTVYVSHENHSPWTSLIFKYAGKWISLTCALAVAGMLHHHSQALLLNHGTGHWLKIGPVLCLCVWHEGSDYDHIIYSHQVNQGIKLDSLFRANILIIVCEISGRGGTVCIYSHVGQLHVHYTGPSRFTWLNGRWESSRVEFRQEGWQYTIHPCGLATFMWNWYSVEECDSVLWTTRLSMNCQRMGSDTCKRTTCSHHSELMPYITIWNATNRTQKHNYVCQNELIAKINSSSSSL